MPSARSCGSAASSSWSAAPWSRSACGRRWPRSCARACWRSPTSSSTGSCASAWLAFFPRGQRGELAVLYCFAFLVIATRGGGRLSVDGRWARRGSAAPAATFRPRTPGPACRSSALGVGLGGGRRRPAASGPGPARCRWWRRPRRSRRRPRRWPCRRRWVAAQGHVDAADLAGLAVAAQRLVGAAASNAETSRPSAFHAATTAAAPSVRRRAGGGARAARGRGDDADQEDDRAAGGGEGFPSELHGCAPSGGGRGSGPGRGDRAGARACTSRDAGLVVVVVAMVDDNHAGPSSTRIAGPPTWTDKRRQADVDVGARCRARRRPGRPARPRPGCGPRPRARRGRPGRRSSRPARRRPRRRAGRSASACSRR